MHICILSPVEKYNCANFDKYVIVICCRDIVRDIVRSIVRDTFKDIVKDTCYFKQAESITHIRKIFRFDMKDNDHVTDSPLAI